MYVLVWYKATIHCYLLYRLLGKHLMYLEKTKISEDELNECLKRDVVWDAQICLDKCLVDEIL